MVCSLDLSDNALGAEGGRGLARALRTSQALRLLDLRLNRLGDAGGCPGRLPAVCVWQGATEGAFGV